MNRFRFLNFSEVPTVLDQIKLSSRGQGETLLERIYFSEFLKKFPGSFLCFWDTLIG
jgi:hypothetical protein